MKMNKKTKIILGIVIAIAIVVALVVYLFNSVKKASNSSTEIKKEIDIEYNINDVAHNMPSNVDLSSLIEKLNNNVNGMVLNGKLNIMNNFKFNEDFTLTTKEFCCLLNLIYQHVNEDSTVNFKEFDLEISSSSVVKYKLTLFIEINKTDINNKLKLDLKNNLLLEVKYFKNKNKIEVKDNPPVIETINGKNYSEINSSFKSLITEVQNLNVFDELTNNLKTLFNISNYDFIDGGVKIYA